MRDAVLGSLAIKASVKGGISPFDTVTLSYSGHIGGGSIGRLDIGGALIAGQATGLNASVVVSCGSIEVSNNLGAVTIGRIEGNLENRASIQARGQANSFGATDLAIGSLTVLGDVQYADIIAGYQPPHDLYGAGLTANEDAQIRRV